jgi:hypothetical protein
MIEIDATTIEIIVVCIVESVFLVGGDRGVLEKSAIMKVREGTTV